MRKFKYIFLLAGISIFFVACLKNQPQQVGATGTQGQAGAPGGNFLPVSTTLQLTSNSLVGSGSAYFDNWEFSGYNPHGTYMLSAYVSRVNILGQTPIWYKLPYNNVFQNGDQLYAYLKYDTVKVCYNDGGGSPWPIDSIMNCQIILVNGVQ